MGHGYACIVSWNIIRFLTFFYCSKSVTLRLENEDCWIKSTNSRRRSRTYSTNFWRWMRDGKFRKGSTRTEKWRPRSSWWEQGEVKIWVIRMFESEWHVYNNQNHAGVPELCVQNSVRCWYFQNLTVIFSYCLFLLNIFNIKFQVIYLYRKLCDTITTAINWFPHFRTFNAGCVEEGQEFVVYVSFQ